MGSFGWVKVSPGKAQMGIWERAGAGGRTRLWPCTGASIRIHHAGR